MDQSQGANWTLFPEPSMSIQSAETAWMISGSVEPFDQSTNQLCVTWGRTALSTRNGSCCRRLCWSGGESLCSKTRS